MAFPRRRQIMMNSTTTASTPAMIRIVVISIFCSPLRSAASGALALMLKKGDGSVIDHAGKHEKDGVPPTGTGPFINPEGLFTVSGKLVSRRYLCFYCAATVCGLWLPG